MAKKTRAKAAASDKPAPRRRSKKSAAEASSRGLPATEVTGGAKPEPLLAAEARVQSAGGTVLGSFRDPLGGHWQALAALPVSEVAPTPFQRDLSPTHVGRLRDVIARLDWFIDPVVVVPARGDGSAAPRFWTPNGYHRLEALKGLGARSIIALVLPEPEIAYQILALNTEKAHNVKEKSLEVIRMARFFAELDPSATEERFALEFEEPVFVTLGCCYEERGRFSGGAYQSMLRRVESFLPKTLGEALAVRTARAARLFELDDKVAVQIEALKARGLTSPYLKAFVLARIDPLRFKRGARGEFDETVSTMLEKLASFDPAKVKADQVAQASGPPDEA